MTKNNEDKQGWISLHRKIRDNWIWTDPVKLKWWLDIVMEVNHKARKVNIGLHIVDCGRGQSIRSLQGWAERWNVSKSSARHFLNLLHGDSMIILENIKISTRITVCNYDNYNNVAHARETDEKREAYTNNNDKQLKKGFSQNSEEKVDVVHYDNMITNDTR